MKIVFMGTPSFAVPILEALIEKYGVALVVTQPDKEVGRKRILTPSPVKEVAIKHNIEVFQPTKIREDYQRVLDVNPDIIITAAYGQIIPSVLLYTPKYKAVNVHASLLPKYRGGAPIHWALINGDSEAGVTIMYMAEKMDDGNIISQAKIETLDYNTTTLTEKLSVLGRDLLIETLPKIFDNSITSIKQNEEEVTFAYNISKDDEKINWNKEGIMVYNQIRGLSYNPGAYFIYKDKKVKVYSSSFVESDIIGDVCEIVDTNKKLGIKVNGGILYINEIQLEGKNKMAIKDFLNGMGNYFVKGEKVN